MAYLDPKNDLTFKKVFGEHPDLLKSLLNALLPLAEGQEIESLEYLPVELTPVIPRFKNSMVDVRCYDNFGRHFLVEMQMLWTDNFKSRVLFNASKAYVKQLAKGEYYEDLQPVYSLNFVNESFQPDQIIFYHHYAIVNIENTEQRIRGLEFIFIELPHFKPATILEKKMAVLWLRFLTEIEHGTRDAPEDLLQNEETKKALGILQESALSPAELEYYDSYWNAIAKEKMIRDEMNKRVLKEVHERLIQQGVKQGVKQGVIKQAVSTALKMINKGFDNEVISGLTDLAISEIQTLRQTGTLD